MVRMRCRSRRGPGASPEPTTSDRATSLPRHPDPVQAGHRQGSTCGTRGREVVMRPVPRQRPAGDARRRRRGVGATAILFLLAGCTAQPTQPEARTGTPAPQTSAGQAPITPTSPESGPLPRPDHVMVVVFENEDATDVVGSPHAPYLSSLAAAGTEYTDAHAETHPSQPNYLALFSGSTQDVTDDRCPVDLG